MFTASTSGGDRALGKWLATLGKLPTEREHAKAGVSWIYPRFMLPSDSSGVPCYSKVVPRLVRTLSPFGGFPTSKVVRIHPKLALLTTDQVSCLLRRQLHIALLC